jgi:Peptidase propeptide and YPEB domain
MKRFFSIALLLVAAFTLKAVADPVTAFDLIKEGDKFVGDPAKDKVIVIHSDKSIGELTPKVWNVIYFDPTATFKATRVKFAAGQMMEVKRPMRMMVTTTPMDHDKLKIDSDQALNAALKEPMLEKLTVKATQFTLENDDNGPTWKITLWVVKLSDTTKLVDIGEVHISAESGKILKNDLHINRAS